mmetsp:Transcript_13935/g.27077  ORF Transcript_13935/g.27077 Transcript_13935/m.27077 type:complete len:227 (+) Transcript_13935:3006-3686(+)
MYLAITFALCGHKINIRFGRVIPKYTCCSLNRVTDSQWNMTIKSHRLVNLVLKHIEIIITVRLVKRCFTLGALCIFEIERRSVLRNTVDMFATHKSDVKTYRRSTMGLCISVSTERLRGIRVVCRVGRCFRTFTSMPMSFRIITLPVFINRLAVFTPVNNLASWILTATQLCHTISHGLFCPQISIFTRFALVKVQHVSAVDLYDCTTCSGILNEHPERCGVYNRS